MTYTFTLDKASFTRYPKLQNALANVLAKTNTVATTRGYNRFVKQLVATLQKTPLTINDRLFQKEKAALVLRSPLIEKTRWGGVSIKKVDTEKDFVQKLLLVKQYGILGFEVHKRKREKLCVKEGFCLLLSLQHSSKQWKKGLVTIALGATGKRVTLEPGDEHGIIALTNCVIEETSTNHLDDLVYIFLTRQVATLRETAAS